MIGGLFSVRVELFLKKFGFLPNFYPIFNVLSPAQTQGKCTLGTALRGIFLHYRSIFRVVSRIPHWPTLYIQSIF